MYVRECFIISLLVVAFWSFSPIMYSFAKDKMETISSELDTLGGPYLIINTRGENLLKQN